LKVSVVRASSTCDGFVPVQSITEIRERAFAAGFTQEELDDCIAAYTSMRPAPLLAMFLMSS
jgi:hypothetical protein